MRQFSNLRARVVTPAAALAFAFGICPAEAESSVTYEGDIRPILKAHCFHCHGEDGVKRGELDLRMRRLITKGGESGAAITPGDHAASLLWKNVESRRMPKSEDKLSDEEVQLIAKWIDAGAPTQRPEPTDLDPDEYITLEERNHWAFRPIRLPDLPPASDHPSARTPIDGFVLQRLRERGLAFNSHADRRTLIRRAYFDLIGLPPEPDAVEAFVNDPSPQAWERVIDRLLASPRYGERWGRHWLDVAGYADSEGYDEKDNLRPYAYKYRDYVIRSFNEDKPWDEFIREQLAGDEMIRVTHANATSVTDDPRALDRFVATGFLRMAPDGTDSANNAMARNHTITETVKIVSSSLLGMTVGCAECHNHRFDPILQKDFYRLRAIFEPAYDWKNWRRPRDRRVSLYTSEQRKRAAEIEADARRIDEEFRRREQEIMQLIFERELVKIPEAKREFARKAYETPASKRTPEQKKFLANEYPNVNVRGGGALRLYLNVYKDGKDLEKELDAIRARASKVRAKKPKEDFLRALTEVPGKVPVTHLFHRGSSDSPEDPVSPGPLSVLCGEADGSLPENNPKLPSTGRRLAYAEWLTNGRHPLVARVLVNRFWLHHFGKGLVATPGDFGTQGVPPTHPELLDWLARDFMNHGWKLKRLHKLILMSTTYRQSSARNEKAASIDSDNAYYWRMPVRRLEAEVIRDAMLAVSGRLNENMFGNPVPVSTDPDGQFVVGGDKPTPGRTEFKRSVYVQVRRSQTVTLLDNFDAPQMEPNCEQRNVSTVAPQALSIMNSRFAVELAGDFAERIRHEAGDSVEAQIGRAWRLAYAADPTPGEWNAVQAYLAEQTEHFRAGQSAADRKKQPNEPEHLALASLCQVIVGSNGFLYVD